MAVKFTWVLLLVCSCTLTYACPFCKSPTATQIRASLFGPDLYYNLLATLLPFITFSIIIIAIHRLGKKRSPQS
jgi:hypothetical protein